MDWRKLYRILAKVSFPLRILTPLLIISNPFIATIGSVLLDTVDGSFYYQLKIGKVKYHLIDKSLDLYWYSISLVFAVHFLPYTTLLVGLYVFRLVGHLIFYKTKNNKVFYYFPNFYENVFIFLLFANYFPKLQSLNFTSVLLVLCVAKIIQELIAHKWIKIFISRMPEWARGPYE